MNTSSREYLPFVDWMKALGIVLIVVGHVAAAPINGMTPPFYPKQLGVAFFIFVMGYSLAREHRPGWQVLFNRVFELFLFGIPIALVMSVLTYATLGSLALSNYLPFLLGANLLFNNFPANPTTWYIGTYLHLLLIWLLVLRGVRIRLWMFAVSIPAEIVVRAMLKTSVGDYTSYMLATNWASVFLLGTWSGQRPLPSQRRHPAIPVAALVVLAVAWPLLVGPTVVVRSFPFMHLSFGVSALDPFLTSTCVSALYLLATWLIFRVTSRLPAPSTVRFVARNTLIIFIGHMPLFYALAPVLKALGWSYTARSVLLVSACIGGLGGLSEVVRRMVRPEVLRLSIFRRMSWPLQGQ